MNELVDKVSLNKVPNEYQVIVLGNLNGINMKNSIVILFFI